MVGLNYKDGESLALRKTVSSINRAIGQQIAEFAAAFVVLVVAVIIPFIDFGTLALRWGLAADLIGSFAPKLAVMDKLSEAFDAVGGGDDAYNSQAKQKAIAIDKSAMLKKSREDALTRVFNAQSQVEKDSADPVARQNLERAQSDLAAIDNESQQALTRASRRKDVRKAAGENQLFAMLSRVNGVKPMAANLTMVVESQGQGGPSIKVSDPSEIPQDWLPNGKNCPCLYRLELSVKAEVEPLFLVPVGGNGIPGLNASVPLTVTKSAIWENLGRDPLTGKYYLNE